MYYFSNFKNKYLNKLEQGLNHESDIYARIMKLLDEESFLHPYPIVTGMDA